jgi:muramidase (phage lysozyme)
MAQAVEHLLCKHEDLSSKSSHRAGRVAQVVEHLSSKFEALNSNSYGKNKNDQNQSQQKKLNHKICYKYKGKYF